MAILTGMGLLMFMVRSSILFFIVLFISGCTAFADNPPERIYDHGTYKGVAFNLDCQGAGITCTQSGITGTLTVSGGSSSGGGSGNVGIGTSGWNTIYASNGSTVTASSVLQTVNGNIGINNSSPGQQLDVTGTVRATNLVKNGGASSQFLKADGSIDSSSYIVGNQNITLSNDASGSGTTSIPVTLATVNSNVGTFQGLTVNGKGLVTAATNQNYSTGSLWATQNTTDQSLSGGNVGIGTTLTTNAALTVMNGNVGIGTWNPGDGFIIKNGNVGIGTNTPNVLLGVGSTNQFNVNSNGNLGIGVSNASFPFQVVGLNSGGTASLGEFLNISGTTNSIAQFTLANGGATLQIQDKRTNAVSAGDSDFIFTSSSGGVTNRMILASNGNVGIATLSPASVFSVNGNASFGSYAATKAAPAGGIIASGNMGIGTFSPLTALQITGVGQANSIGVFHVINTDNSSQINDFSLLNPNLTSGNQANFIMGTASSAKNNFSETWQYAGSGSNNNSVLFQFNSVSTPSFLLSAGGNVGIGTLLPRALLDVTGTTTSQPLVYTAAGNLGIGQTIPVNKLDVNGSAAIGSYNGVNTATSNGLIVSGNVGVGTWAPQNNLQIAGNIGYTGRIIKRITTYATASSITPNTDTDDISYMNNSQGVATFTVNADAGSNQVNGQSWILKIKSSAVQTFSWNAQYVGGSLGLPSTTLGTSTIQYFAFIWDSVNSKWDYSGNVGGF